MGRLTNTQLAGSSMDRPSWQELCDKATSSHERLKRALADEDNGTALIAQADMNQALELMSSLEFGRMGTAPT